MFILIVITIELIVEFTGLIDDSYRPILNLITKRMNNITVIMVLINMINKALFVITT